MKETVPTSIIRIAAASMMLIHGCARALSNGVTPFAIFLQEHGFPGYLAIGITALEIIAALLIISRKFIIPLSIVFIIELVFGLILVHLKNGWFVVGGGQNGMEFSVLLIVCFISTILFEWVRNKNKMNN